MHGLTPGRCLAAAFALLMPAAMAAAQEENGTVSTQQLSDAQATAEALSVLAYWTPERMARAEEMPTPTTTFYTEFELASMAAPRALEVGDPGAVNGHPPGGGPFVPEVRTYTREEAAAMAEAQAFGTPPTNPQSGPYGPFQRWTMQGRYLNWPRSVHGKLFFTLPTGNFVCSATVIGRSTIATAGHCISNGSGSFATNVLYCPSYINNPTGPHPERGCWPSVSITTSAAWHNSGDPDYDYACFVTATSGTVVGNKIGNVTGWAGRAWNWNDAPVITFGYPQGSPFQGNTIQQTASVEWYDVQFTAGGPASKVIGSDLTGGSSGGGWFLSWRAPGAEIADTDGSGSTDPACALCGPHLNGVNSHKRCLVNCSSPPTATQGLFWQEMSSPRFRNVDDDNGDSEDVFAVCLAHANNNP